MWKCSVEKSEIQMILVEFGVYEQIELSSGHHMF